MKIPSKIDLHMHSTVSDGSDTPEQILENVKKTGIGLFSLTDHDDTAGCLRIRQILSSGDPLFINGVEFSCEDGEGNYHILSYGYDPDSPSIRKVVETGHGYRMQKAGIRLERLAQVHGISFSQEDVDAFLALPNPGKPHLANLLIKYGYVGSIPEAMEKYLNAIRVPELHVLPGEAIEGVLGSGGIPVLAHPLLGSGSQSLTAEQMDARLRKLISFGLQGVEAFYSAFTSEMTQLMLDLADTYGLYVTAGSDYHGSNKPIALGQTGLADAAAAPQSLLRFLEKVS